MRLEDMASLLDKYGVKSVAVFIRDKGRHVEVKVYDYSKIGKPALLDMTVIVKR